MLKKMIFFGAIAMMFTMSAFAQNETTTVVENNRVRERDSKDSKNMSGKKNPDSKFMMTLAMGNMNEITLSETAVSKASSEEVKTYAQKMIDDHTMAGDELKALAASKNVMISMQADAKHMAMKTKLEGMSGSQFDMEYMKAMVKDHEKTVALLQKESSGGKDPEAKALAAKLLPTVQGHLDMARTMMSGMSGKKDMKMMEKSATTN